MGEILELVPWVVALALLFALLSWDEARLSPEQLARAGHPRRASSRSSTSASCRSRSTSGGRWRRSAAGILLGFAWAAAITLVDEGVAEGVDLLVRGHLLP